MELTKKKSREVSETDILLTAMKDLLDKLEMEEKKVEALKRKRDVLVLILLLYIAVLYQNFSDHEYYKYTIL